jgi:hypothetical protein
VSRPLRNNNAAPSAWSPIAAPKALITNRRVSDRHRFTDPFAITVAGTLG